MKLLEKFLWVAQISRSVSIVSYNRPITKAEMETFEGIDVRPQTRVDYWNIELIRGKRGRKIAACVDPVYMELRFISAAFRPGQTEDLPSLG